MKKIYNVELKGDLDTVNILEYHNKVLKIIEDMTSTSILLLIFDKVTYMNSTSVGHVADWYNKINEKNGEIIIIGINKNILDIFELVGLVDRITFYDDVKEFKEKTKN